MTINKLLIAAALAAPAMIAVATPAQAQVAGIATIDPAGVVARTKAFAAASKQIGETYKDNNDQIRAKLQEQQKLLAQLDKNGDKQVDDAELKAAEDAKNPALAQLKTIEGQVNQLGTPAVRAQAYAIEKILERYQEAQNSVVASKKINIILRQESILFAPDAVDVTVPVAAAIDGLAPTVSTVVPANWQPQRETLAIQESVQQILQYASAVAAAQARQGAAAGGAKPAAPAPGGAAPAPAKPVTR